MADRDATEPDPALGRRIAETRRARRLSQHALATAIGLDRTAVSKMESGRRRISALELARIARALGRPVESFLTPTQDRRGDTLRLLRRRRKSILRVASRHGGRSVRVFGSVVRREDRPGSDVDFLVEFESGRSLFDQAALLLDLRDLLGRPVDVVSPEGLRDRIREEVLREAVPL